MAWSFKYSRVAVNPPVVGGKEYRLDLDPVLTRKFKEESISELNNCEVYPFTFLYNIDNNYNFIEGSHNRIGTPSPHVYGIQWYNAALAAVNNNPQGSQYTDDDYFLCIVRELDTNKVYGVRLERDNTGAIISSANAGPGYNLNNLPNAFWIYVLDRLGIVGYKQASDGSEVIHFTSLNWYKTYLLTNPGRGNLSGGEYRWHGTHSSRSTGLNLFYNEDTKKVYITIHGPMGYGPGVFGSTVTLKRTDIININGTRTTLWNNDPIVLSSDIYNGTTNEGYIGTVNNRGDITLTQYFAGTYPYNYSFYSNIVNYTPDNNTLIVGKIKNLSTPVTIPVNTKSFGFSDVNSYTAQYNNGGNNSFTYTTRGEITLSLQNGHENISSLRKHYISLPLKTNEMKNNLILKRNKLPFSYIDKYTKGSSDYTTINSTLTSVNKRLNS